MGRMAELREYCLSQELKFVGRFQEQLGSNSSEEERREALAKALSPIGDPRPEGPVSSEFLSNPTREQCFEQGKNDIVNEYWSIIQSKFSVGEQFTISDIGRIANGVWEFPANVVQILFVGLGGHDFLELTPEAVQDPANWFSTVTFFISACVVIACASRFD